MKKRWYFMAACIVAMLAAGVFIYNIGREETEARNYSCGYMRKN